jgi:hypothetical protein
VESRNVDSMWVLLSRRDRMIVARQFTAWNPCKKGIRPVGTV